MSRVLTVCLDDAAEARLLQIVLEREGPAAAADPDHHLARLTEVAVEEQALSYFRGRDDDPGRRTA